MSMGKSDDIFVFNTFQSKHSQDYSPNSLAAASESFEHELNYVEVCPYRVEMSCRANKQITATKMSKGPMDDTRFSSS